MRISWPSRRFVAVSLVLTSFVFACIFAVAVHLGYGLPDDEHIVGSMPWSPGEYAVRNAARLYAFSPFLANASYPSLSVTELSTCWSDGDTAAYNPAGVSILSATAFRLHGFELQQALIVSPVHRRSWVTDLGPGQYLVEVVLERSAGNSTNE